MPLSTGGIRQAEMLRQRVAKEKIVAVYSSDLSRALDTATIIAVPHGIPVVASQRLREMNFGQFEGMTFDEIKRRYPGAERFWSGANPESGFPGGESLKAMASRVERFVLRLSRHSPSDTVLVVAHGGSLRMLVCRMLGLHFSHWWRISVAHASLTILDSSPQGAVLRLLNDVSHLEQSRWVDK